MLRSVGFRVGQGAWGGRVQAVACFSPKTAKGVGVCEPEALGVRLPGSRVASPGDARVYGSPAVDLLQDDIKSSEAEANNELCFNL